MVDIFIEHEDGTRYEGGSDFGQAKGEFDSILTSCIPCCNLARLIAALVDKCVDALCFDFMCKWSSCRSGSWPGHVTKLNS